MNKFYSLLATAMFAVSVNAQTTTEVVNDTFSYTGALNANGWATHSGTAGQILSDGNVAKLIAGNSEDINRAFSTSYPVAAGKVSVKLFCNHKYCKRNRTYYSRRLFFDVI